jgi:3-oxoacyl-[acyl-carrier-protein] synthase II
MNRRVVVTGWGIVTSISCNVDDCWKRILSGESGIHPIELIDVSDQKVKFGGDVRGWDATQALGQKEVNKLDRYSQFAMVAADDAIRFSGLPSTATAQSQNKLELGQRYGVVLGSGIGGMVTHGEQLEKLITKGPGRVSPMTIPKLMLNAAGGNIAIKHGYRGPNYSVATACASATNALGNAFDLIRMNVCDGVVTGGSEAAIDRLGLAAFSNMKALSTYEGDPTKASRPFDLNRDGFVFSEGAGVLIFESLEHAEARGAKILAEVVGFGTTCDAGHITSPDERGEGAAAAMQAALDSCNLNPGQIDYINAHGTSTPLGDKAETRAVKHVFGDHAYRLSISSTKSSVGHSLGASGGIELILTIKAILDGIVPPTINLETPDPDCDLDYTPNLPKPREIRYAMSNSFGFGGHNASIIVKRFEA